MQLLKIVAVVTFFVSRMTAVCAEEAVFIDKGACPGERCSYGDSMTAHSDFHIYETASSSSEIIGSVLAGEVFFSRSGEVHTLPARFEVFNKIGKFKPGDEVLVLTYEGLGFYRARHNGNLIAHFELGYDPWGGNPAISCDRENENCLGKLVEPVKSTWWINILSSKGTQGWLAYYDSISERPNQ